MHMVLGWSICNHDVETADHLFFKCRYTSLFWMERLFSTNFDITSYEAYSNLLVEVRAPQIQNLIMTSIIKIL